MVLETQNALQRGKNALQQENFSHKGAPWKEPEAGLEDVLHEQLRQSSVHVCTYIEVYLLEQWFSCRITPRDSQLGSVLIWSRGIMRHSRVARFFLVRTYQIGKNIPYDHKLYQTAINYTNRHKLYQLAVKYSNIYHSKALHNLPEKRFLVWK
jgi:hypothetical protein